MKYGYDDIGQLKTARGSESGGATRWHELFGYTYDASGNLNYRTNNLFLQSFRVNELNQLTNVSRASSGYTVSGTTTRTATSMTVNTLTADRYADAMFARTNLSLSDGQNTFTAVAQDSYGRTDTNTVTAWLPASANCVYDQNGNMIGDGRRGFAYDDENQLIQVLVTNASGAVTKSDFAYDGKMRRRIRTESALGGGVWVTNLVVRYVYDGNLVLQERHYTLQISSTVPQQTVSYTRGKDLSGSLAGSGGIGGLLARSDISNLQSPHALYHADGNGNVTCLIGVNGGILAQYEYDPFGSIQSQAGPLAEANLYRFSSKEFHANSGLVYYLYRYYEPGMQRWINRDPISEKGGKNLYQYLLNSPVINIDKYGLFVGGEPPKEMELIGMCLGIRYRRQAELDEQTKSGKHSKNYDKWYHCVTSCEITQVCGAEMAELGEFKREHLWERKPRIGEEGYGDWEDSQGDMFANMIGRVIGKQCPKVSCEKACEEKGFTRYDAI